MFKLIFIKHHYKYYHVNLQGQINCLSNENTHHQILAKGSAETQTEHFFHFHPNPQSTPNRS